MIEVEWRKTDLPCIEGITLINNRSLNTEIADEVPVGEVPVWKELWRRGKTKGPIPGANGLHMCHPEWFAVGEPWPVTLPDTEYGPNGLPLCCGQFADPAEGGVVFGCQAGDKSAGVDATAGGVVVGGQAGDVWMSADAARGGVEIGGAAGDVSTAIDATAGGLVVGGAAGDVSSAIDPTAGGLVVGGAAGDVWQGPDATEGGVEIGGAAGDVSSALDATAGGLVVGGAAGDVSAGVDPTAGGVVFGGAAGDKSTAVDPTAGGLVMGGAAGDVLRMTDATAGGVVFGGAAGDVFDAGGPSIRASTSGTITSEADITLPTRVSGDALEVWVGAAQADVPDANSGWTKRQSRNHGGGTGFIAVYTRTSDGTDSTAPFTSTFTNGACYVAVSIMGVTPTWNSDKTAGSGTSMDADTITPSVAPTILVCGYSQANASNHIPALITLPGSLAFLGDASYASGALGSGTLTLGWELRTTTAATGIRTATSSQSAGWASVTMTVG